MIESHKCLEGRDWSPVMAATTGLSSICYNHPDKKADFKCFDCKLDSVINLCAQCNIQVHSLDVFRAHKVEQIIIKDRERRLSQDINDIEKLIAVESDLLQNVLVRLKYCEQEEKETLSHLIQLQTATKRRLSEIRECETRIDKAFSYLTKVSSMLTQCSSPAENSDSDGNVKDPIFPEANVSQDKSSGPLLEAPQQPPACPPQGLVSDGEAQNGPPKEHPLTLPDEIKGKDVFRVSVVGSLARNGSFWMIKTRDCDFEVQRQIQAGIRAHYKLYGYGDIVEVNVGTLCAKLNRFNKEFCRVRIESVSSSGMVKLRFVDLGFTEEVQPSSLCQLPKEFVDIPFQAMECCLLPNLDTQLPYEAKWCFKDLTFSKVLMAAVEGQVTDKKGHSVIHVTLASCGEVSVCINTKVASLVEEQNLAQENRPLQPKTVKVENGIVTEEDAKQEINSPFLGESSSNSAPNIISIAAEEKEVLNTDGKTALSTASEDSGVTQTSKDTSPSLRVEAAEFIPTSPENSSQSKIPFHVMLEEQSNVPGILHLPVTEDKTVNASPENDSCETFPDTLLPPGCIDVVAYNRIVTQCSLNMVPVEFLPKARFVMIRSNVRRIIEGMKCGFWSSTPDINKRLNRIYHEQSKNGGPVFLLFSGPKSLNFCGLAQMVSAVDLSDSCPALNRPFPFANRMIGKCSIRWIHAHDLPFIDVFSSNCGYNKWYFADCVNGFEVPNKLGQLVVKGYESSNNFRSILQHALESYQTALIEKQAINDTSKPATSYKPVTPDENLPLSQEEDWDLEIEENLKAAKAMNTGPLDVGSEGEEVKSCLESVTNGSSPVQTSGITADTESIVADGTVHSFEVCKDSNVMTFSSEQDDIKAVNSQDEDSLLQDSNSLEAVKAQSHSCPSLSSEASVAGVSESQSSTEVTFPSYEAEPVKGLPADDVLQESSIECANTSDWEGTTSPRASGLEIVFTATEQESSKLDNTVTESEQTLSSSDPSAQGFSISNESQSTSKGLVDIIQKSDWSDLGNEPTSEDGTFQEDVTTSNSTELSQGEDSDPGKSKLTRHVLAEDKLDNGGVSVDFLSGDRTLDDEGGNVDVNNAEILSVPDGETTVEQLSSEWDPQDDGCVASDLDNSEVTSNQGATANGEHHGSCEDLLIDYEDLPVEKGKEYYVFAKDNLSTTGTFWAHLHQTKEEERAFVDTMISMGARIEAKKEPLDDIYIYKPCAVKAWDGYWYRALVEKTPDKGKVGIRRMDVGDYWDVDQKELRVLDDEFYAAPPAQAFECCVCYENPASKKEKARIARAVKKNKKLKILVKSFNEGTVGVQIL